MGNFTITIAKSGHKTLHYTNGQQTIRIHSAYDPVKEAQRIVEQCTPKRASLIIVCGLGLGYHILALKDKFPQLTIIVIEKDKNLIQLVQQEFPEVFTCACIVNDEEEIAKVLELLDIRSFRGTALLVHRPSYLLHPEFYDALTASIHKQISSRISDLLTRFEFEELWVKNILLNAKQMHSALPVKSLFGKFKGIPGIIVSAGPSLIHSLDALLQAYDKALIVCVDTAYKVLERHNIMPHIVMTLDAQAHSIKHFLGITQKPILLADVVSSPKVTRLIEKKFFSTTAKYYTAPDGSIQRESTPIMDWIQSFTGQIGDIQSGGSVATSAFDLLLTAGCSAIVLVGQDLAYTGREIHSQGTHHNDDWLPVINRFKNLDTINQNVIRKRKIKYVPSNNGGTVITDFVLDLYRTWFEDSAKRVPIPVYNTSTGGAFIANTTFTPLQALVEKWKKPPVSPQEIISHELSHNTPINTKSLFMKFSRLYQRLKELQTAAVQDTANLYSILDDEDMYTLCSPFMRKTLFYIARHNLDEQKIDTLIKDSARAAARELLKIFAKLEDSLI
ncbi:MAG: 6-hydroxymethylpterin diphosphokinase MptE-like protein [Spirochaetota bacterium]